VRKVDSSGNITVVAGVAGETGNNDGPSTCLDSPDPCNPARLNDPRGVAVDGAGNVYIADTGNDKIRKVAGNVVTTIAAGVLDGPTGVAVAADGTVYIADHNNNRVQRVSGANVTTVPVTGLKGPNGIALDPATGDLYIADTQNNRIIKVDFTP
jgi:serine/threonine-protein kinase